ncbi:spore germination protein GerPB [Thermicanus aegyptius]|uniref:spore germination protein GerPB n=1 Tax=Thermicanus aegyptius TaxID=94009 RepID=UPI000417775F|nr:spore germination protein GerPB [Thermicanus aegyptius]
MRFFISQNIIIYTLSIRDLSTASVLQIGSSGKIETLANVYNTGGFPDRPAVFPPVRRTVLVPLPPTSPSQTGR